MMNEDMFANKREIKEMFEIAKRMIDKIVKERKLASQVVEKGMEKLEVAEKQKVKGILYLEDDILIDLQKQCALLSDILQEESRR